MPWRAGAGAAPPAAVGMDEEEEDKDDRPPVPAVLLLILPNNEDIVINSSMPYVRSLLALLTYTDGNSNLIGHKKRYGINNMLYTYAKNGFPVYKKEWVTVLCGIIVMLL
jgi:hypothetical protein